MQKPFIDSFYSSGEFYSKSTGHYDAQFKVTQLNKLLNSNSHLLQNKFNHIADVGCGSGHTTIFMQKMLSDFTGTIVSVDGYDVHPYLEKFQEDENVHFIYGDFSTKANKMYDLAVLFDVIEHIPDPVQFIKNLSSKARLFAFHIPLDNSLFVMLRNLSRSNLSIPGHLLILDLPAAINLLTLSGLRVIDYEYSPGFSSLSKGTTLFQKALFSIRWLLFQLNPFIAQKLVAGVSLTVLARPAIGYADERDRE
jgi:SAM-dependent methyltransferase